MRFFWFAISAAFTIFAAGCSTVTSSPNPIVTITSSADNMQPLGATNEDANNDHDSGSTYYLEMTMGCYSITSPTQNRVSFDFEFKEVFAKSCSEPHHLQVFAAGEVTPAGQHLTQDDMLNYCSAAFKAKYGLSFDEAWYEGLDMFWFFPDPGMETEKYGSHGVCTLVNTQGEEIVVSNASF